MSIRQQNQDGKEVGNKVLKKQDEVGKRNPDGDQVTRTETETRFKPKAGSIFPKKRKLVKRMILDGIIQSFTNTCRPGRVADDGES